ncbi:unnamed protein product [Symbiodinium natans]|uniref:Uncharacterized protein n=1 Tax=Symbiodinium natans TaxID=878477 RepID=A0A812IHM4_9DINO|nr:unnamed protein product [Symbiodinium natans]
MESDGGCVPLPGRRRTRTDFSAADLDGSDREDWAASLPLSTGGTDEICRNDAPNLLQDFNSLQILPKSKPCLPSLDEFLTEPRSLSEFLAPDDDHSDKRRCWTADVSELQS